nr:DUF445 family protein [Aquibacillus albus]
MVIIGAVIGGVTNSLAIKMLFRPYQAKFLGSWKLPFTPGLIPKRREELAKQLGRTVVEHLLTAEGLQKKLKQSEFQKQVITWSQAEMKRVLDQRWSTKQMLENVGVYITEEDIRKSIYLWSKKQVSNYLLSKQDQTVNELIGETNSKKVDDYLDQFAIYLQERLTQFVGSESAGIKIGRLIETYLGGKGFIGNMISSFLGNEGLTEKVQPLIVEYSQSEEALDMLKQALKDEWNKWANRTIGEVKSKMKEIELEEVVGKGLSSSLPVDQWLDKTVKDWIKPFESKIYDQILPIIITKILDTFANRTQLLLEKFNLEEIVEKEVRGFPISRVEELVLNISRKEFKLITYLGALLGGVIGLVQGLIVVFLR